MCVKERRRRYQDKLKVRAFDAIGRACVFCESEDDVQAAHVLPTDLRGPGRGKKRRFADVVRKPEAYRPMCRRCHRTFDALVARMRAVSRVEEEIPF